MSGPSSIESFVDQVLADLSNPDEGGDRVDMGWLEACEAIKTHIEAGVPLKGRVELTPLELLKFFGDDEPYEIARYLAMQLTDHRCVSLIKEIQAHEDPNEEGE